MRSFFLFAAGAFIATPVFAEALEGRETPYEVVDRASKSDWRMLNQENLLYLELEDGLVVIELSTALAPAHKAQLKALAREGFYDGLSFYRVIDGFVAQGGDRFDEREPKKGKKTLPAELDAPMSDDIAFRAMPDADGYAATTGFIDGHPSGMDAEGKRVWHLHCAGAIAMARGDETDSGGTEMYITLHPQRYLDRNVTVFGTVVKGMEHAQALRRVAPPETKDDDRGDKILSLRIGSDLAPEKQVSLRMMDTNKDIFIDYVESRRNRSEAWFQRRPDHIDICQIPVPVEVVADEKAE